MPCSIRASARGLPLSKGRQSTQCFWSATAVTCLGAVLLWQIDPAPVNDPYLAPSVTHLLGTDNSGRDVLALTARATVISLTVGLGAALGATLIGALVGCLAGYRRGVIDTLLMRLTDVFLLVPTLPLVLVLAAYLGPGVFNAGILIGLTAWPSTARVIRARVLSLRDSPFIVNARSMGAGSSYLILRHILPNCGELLLAKASLAVAAALLSEAGISFLGLGDPVRPTWGNMLHDALSGAALINGAWWWFMPPLACISSAVMVFHLVASALGRTRFPAGIARRAIGAHEPPRCDPPHSSTQQLEVRGLTIGFDDATRTEKIAVDALDLTVSHGDKIAIIGATGSGKSLLLLGLLGLLPGDAHVGGQIRVEGHNLNTLSPCQWRRYRGTTAGYIPQGIGDALNPLLPIGRQVAERMWVHLGISRRTALATATDQLSAMGFPDPARLARSYPHQLSGGMKQRVLIAMALAGQPTIVLADEPTKGLDPAAVGKIGRLLTALDQKTVLAVTHDLGFAQILGGRVVVMHAGRVVEQAPADLFFKAPLHPYACALLAAQPSRGMQISGTIPENRKGTTENGCSYRHRCPLRVDACRQRPPLFLYGRQRVRCWRYAT